MASEAVEESAGAGKAFRWRLVLGMAVWYGSMAASIWLLHGWLRRWSGLPADLVWITASLPGNVLGLLLSRRIMRTEPGTSPEQRMREAEKEERAGRGLRKWMILTLSLLLLGQGVSLLGASYDGPAVGADWASLVMVAGFVMCGLTDLLSLDAGASPERVRFEQAAQREALRVGYAVAVVLGLVAASVAVRLPLVAGKAWGAVLLASLLAAEVRRATLPRWTARPAGDVV